MGPLPVGISTTALRRAPPRCLQPVASQDMTCNDKKQKQNGMHWNASPWQGDRCSLASTKPEATSSRFPHRHS